MTLLAQILYSGLGGHGDVAFGIIEGDKDGRFDHVMGFLGIETLWPAYVDECRRHRLSYRYLSATPGQPWRAWPSIFNWLRATKPDVIVLHIPTALLPCAVFAAWYRIPLIVVEHQANSLKKPSEWVFTGLAMLLASRLVLLTDQYAAEVRARLGSLYKPSKVSRIYNGVDMRGLGKQRHRLDLGPTVKLGMAARFTKLKRFDLTIPMLAELIERRPDIEWQLSLAGGGEQWESVRTAVAKAGLQDRIELPGMLDKRELATWFAGLDLYVHITEGETLSISLLQAMAAKLPIVASDVPGVDVLLGGEQPLGRLVADQSEEAFADAIVSLLQDVDATAAMSLRAQKHCREKYSQQRMFTDYAALIDSLLCPHQAV